MTLSSLLVVTDRHGAARPLTETVRAAVAGGARFFWLRDRDLDRDARRDLARDLIALLQPVGGRLVVGGDTDLAAETGAQGVHLPGSAGIDGIRAARTAGRVPSRFRSSSSWASPVSNSCKPKEPSGVAPGASSQPTDDSFWIPMRVLQPDSVTSSRSTVKTNCSPTDP